MSSYLTLSARQRSKERPILLCAQSYIGLSTKLYWFVSEPILVGEGSYIGLFPLLNISVGRNSKSSANNHEVKASSSSELIPPSPALEAHKSPIHYINSPIHKPYNTSNSFCYLCPSYY